MKTPTIEEQRKLLDLYNQGLFEQAVESAEAFIASFPKHSFGWKVLGSSLQNLGKTSDALVAKKMVVELSPNDSDAHNNLAVTFKELELFDEAEKSCRRALELNPESDAAHCNLGNIFKEQEKLEDAKCYYEIALKLNANLAEAHNNLGAVFRKQKKDSDAEICFKQALKINPNFLDAVSNLGRVLFKEKSHPEAIKLFQQAQKDSDLSLWIYSSRASCDWKNIDLLFERLFRYIQNNKIACNPFALISFSNISFNDLKRNGTLFANSEHKSIFQSHIPYITKITHSHQKLRIGYLSADFHNHATVYLLAGILENRNTENFDVYLYSYGVEAKDTSRSRVENACEVFRHVRELSDEEIAQQIVADEIDILVDLKGYTEDSRLGIQALRPAPIVVSWLGYPSTLGHERLADYIIGDATVTPLEHAEHFSETLALMPNCYQPNDNTRPIGVCPTRAEAGLPETGFVFATFNQAYKITPEMFDIWCRLLAEVPNSVLWILEPHEVAQENLRREMTARGVNSSRLIFAPKMPQTEHLGRLQLVDLAVDTFPYTSHTTASDALWVGVPLVTKMDETFASRVAASILRTMNLSELVTDNDADYFNVALNLAQNPEKLAALKQKITIQKQISPLFDTQKFARDLERLYQAIWAQELKGERKAVILDAEMN